MKNIRGEQYTWKTLNHDSSSHPTTTFGPQTKVAEYAGLVKALIPLHYMGFLIVQKRKNLGTSLQSCGLLDTILEWITQLNHLEFPSLNVLKLLLRWVRTSVCLPKEVNEEKMSWERTPLHMAHCCLDREDSIQPPFPETLINFFRKTLISQCTECRICITKYMSSTLLIVPCYIKFAQKWKYCKSKNSFIYDLKQFGLFKWFFISCNLILKPTHIKGWGTEGLKNWPKLYRKATLEAKMGFKSKEC